MGKTELSSTIKNRKKFFLMGNKKASWQYREKHLGKLNALETPGNNTNGHNLFQQTDFVNIHVHGLMNEN